MMGQLVHRGATLAIVIALAGGCGGAAPEPSAGSSVPVSSVPASSVSESLGPEVPEQPTARGYHLLVAAGDRGTLLMGGFTTHGITAADGFPVPGQTHPGRTPDGLWAFDESTGWTSMQPSPDIFATDQVADAAYHAASGRVVMHLTDQRDPTTRLLDPATGVISVSGAAGPSFLLGSMLAYDAGSERVILFGGLGPSTGTWSYDVAADTWTRMTPEQAPGSRNYAAMAYDPVLDRVIIFSGGDPDLEADTWAYDLDTDTWTELRPPAAPDARYYSSMVYDAAGERMIMFGGILETVPTDPGEPGWVHDALLDEWHKPAGDTWAYDGAANTWTQIDTATAPSPRGWHDLAYDGRTGHIVLFGGGPSRSSFTDETWIFDPVAETWTEWE